MKRLSLLSGMVTVICFIKLSFTINIKKWQNKNKKKKATKKRILEEIFPAS